MADVIQCDRCKAIAGQRWAKKMRMPGSKSDIDICDRCVALLKAWFYNTEGLDYRSEFILAAPKGR